ncbi:MAG: GTPase [Methylohalobius sp. ZOD2]
MQNSPEAVEQRIQEWAGRLIEQGWISPAAADSLTQLSNPTAADLFDDSEIASADSARPLVTAFFGGTGVGKSTLLNRLAGEAIATTGIERPTSREVTFYLHEAVPLERMPPELPLDRVRVARHSNTNRREVVWIDMPDIDSIERTNRELVLDLLPYIDVLIYVVSPERYRDDAGWRLLLEQSQGHAFLFVMNHWDEGWEEQIEDFSGQLRSAGFNDPIVLRCDSRPDFDRRKPDDFGKMEEILTALVRAHGVEQLTNRNEQLRLQRVIDRAHFFWERLGETKTLDRLQDRWRKIWKHTLEDLRPGLEWPMQALAREVIGPGRIDRKSKKRKKTDKSAGELKSDVSETLLWDAWIQTRLLDALERLILEAEDLGLPGPPLRQALSSCRDELQEILIDSVQSSLRRSLSTPGHWLQRVGLRLFGALRYLLPLAASGLVGYQLVLRYYEGWMGESSYLGVNFAVHSLLLIGLAWLIPYLLHRLLTPSLEKTALRGIRQGIAHGFERASERVEQDLQSLKEKQRDLAGEGKRLIQALEEKKERDYEMESPPRSEEVKALFSRMLVAG